MVGAARPMATASPSISPWQILHDAAACRGRPANQVEPALQGVLTEVGADDAAELAAALVVAIRGAEE